MGTNTEYKVGMVSQILAAQSSGGGATKKASKKLAALFGGASASSPAAPEAPPPTTAGQVKKKKKVKDKAKKNEKDTKKLKLKIKDALEAINAEDKEKGQKKTKKPKPDATEAEAPKDTPAKDSASKAAKKNLKRKLRKRLNGKPGRGGGGTEPPVASPKSEAWIKKLEGFSEEPNQKKANNNKKGNAPSNDRPAARYHHGADKMENGQGGGNPDPNTRPVWKMSARKLEKRELKKSKRKERRMLELAEKEGKEGVVVPTEQKQPEPEKAAHQEPDWDKDSDDSDSGGKKVKVEPRDKEAESKGEPKTLAEKNAPKTKDAELEARTIFVGNLPSDATKKELSKIFMKFGKLETIRFRCGAPNKPTVLKKVAINKKELHPDNDTIAAYIRYSTVEEAEKAAAKSIGMVFHDHHLTVDVADQGKKRDTKLAIFVGNLNLKLTDEELWRFFEDCGTIVSVRIIRDNATGMGKGFGYVNFEDRDSVDAAITKKNQQELKNRSIRISRCVKKMKMKKHKGSKGGAGKQEGNAGPQNRKFGGKWKGKQNSTGDKKNSKVQKRSEPAHEYSGDRLAEIGKLKRKSNKPNRGEERKANIARLLTEVKPPNKKKTFK